MGLGRMLVLRWLDLYLDSYMYYFIKGLAGFDFCLTYFSMFDDARDTISTSLHIKKKTKLQIRRILCFKLCYKILNLLFF